MPSALGFFPEYLGVNDRKQCMVMYYRVDLDLGEHRLYHVWHRGLKVLKRVWRLRIQICTKMSWVLPLAHFWSFHCDDLCIMGKMSINRNFPLSFMLPLFQSSNSNLYICYTCPQVKTNDQTENRTLQNMLQTREGGQLGKGLTTISSVKNMLMKNFNCNSSF